MTSIPIEFPTDWSEYRLIDSGESEKLESFAGYTIVRPDPRAIWPKRLPIEQWQNVNAIFNRSSNEGKWIYKNQAPANWIIKYRDLKFLLGPTDFRHVGIFPEQSVNWNWLVKKINNSSLKILNLFAYTGAATIVTAKAGAKVTHVDSSKSSIRWANKNAILNNLPDKSIRWVLEDVYKFVDKETRRGSLYEGIILDPPRFGHGAKGEIWKLHDNLSRLLVSCRKLLSNNAKFLLLNVYTADLSPVAVYQLVFETLKDLGGNTEVAELAIKESASDRLLPNGLVVRWSK